MASDLTAIMTKIRRLTKSPSTNQISDDTIKEYINTFVLYDLPEDLRHLALRSIFTFYTKPYQDVYETNDVAGDPFNDFRNNYITVHPPVYVDGSKATLTQSESEFYGVWPKTLSMISIGTGAGVPAAFTGTLSNKPVLSNSVLVSSVDDVNETIQLSDDGDGVLAGTGGFGTIDYVTGEYDITITSNIKTDKAVYIHTYPYSPSKPSSFLYYDMKFTLRPVPDQAYKVDIEVYKKPTEILDAVDNPYLKEWWQYIAYGAAIKVLEDRVDNEGVAGLEPGFDKQKILINRRTIVQQSDERVSTIYANQLLYNNFWNQKDYF